MSTSSASVDARNPCMPSRARPLLFIAASQGDVYWEAAETKTIRPRQILNLLTPRTEASRRVPLASHLLLRAVQPVGVGCRASAAVLRAVEMGTHPTAHMPEVNQDERLEAANCAAGLSESLARE